jgi:hypothetical protein
MGLVIIKETASDLTVRSNGAQPDRCFPYRLFANLDGWSAGTLSDMRGRNTTGNTQGSPHALDRGRARGKPFRRSAI